MDNVRLRRLRSDYEALRRLARVHPKIEIEGASGNPPERYCLVLRVRSLRERGTEIEHAAEHRLEITLPRGHPRDAPLFRMLTPVFHPNIAPHAVCIGDHWTASEPLDQLVQRVGEILAFQSYNIKSPLNGRAAQWVEQHRDQLPIDGDEFFVDIATATPPVGAGGCANCGAAGSSLTCRVGHRLCADCALRCPRCQQMICLACGAQRCTACVPQAASTACQNCGAVAREGSPRCSAGHALCADCGLSCPSCAAHLCLVCGTVPCPSCRPTPRGAAPEA
jgi:ubiquitin-protein ligase